MPLQFYIKNMLLHISIKYLVLESVCPLNNEFIMKRILFLYGYSFQVKGQRIYNVKKTITNLMKSKIANFLLRFLEISKKDF